MRKCDGNTSNCKCDTCRHYKKETREIATHPTSSSCIWNVRTVYRCEAGIFDKQDHKPARAKCHAYSPNECKVIIPHRKAYECQKAF